MKPNNGQLTFINNDIKINEMLYNLTDKEVKKLLLLEKSNRDELLKEIANIMLKYKVTEDSMDLSNEEFKVANRALKQQINATLSKETKDETRKITDLLLSQAEEKYYLNSFNLSLGLDFNLTKIDKKTLNRILKGTVKGENYSDRLWTNKNDISKLLQKDIKEFLNGNISLNQIEKVIKDTYNKNAYQVKRLVNTETARIMEEANDVWREDLDIDYVMYMGTLDTDTCSDCGEYDGQVFKANEKPIDLPQHPNCRCTYSAIVSPDYKPKNRLNNDSRETIDYKTYTEWKEEQGL